MRREPRFFATGDGQEKFMQPVSRATLATQVARQIDDKIRSGEWAVGSKLPSEGELVSTLQVSRNTLREALKAFVHVGMIEARAGDGTYVRASNDLEASFLRRTETIKSDQFTELREIVEFGAAGLAAQRRSAADIRKMKQILGRRLKAAKSGNAMEFADAEMEFHRTVVACSGNPLLVEIYTHLGRALALAAEPATKPDDHHVEGSHQLHESLVEAIAAKDSGLAGRRMAELIEAFWQNSRL
jgi:DNA-binding FadR family transcriptional regulator